MPATTLLEIPPAEQAQMRTVLRRMRYGYLLAFHILLLCSNGRNPTEIAAFLFCSRSSVYRIVRAYRAGRLGIRLSLDHRIGHFMIFEVDLEAQAPAPPIPKWLRTSSAASDRRTVLPLSSRQAG